MITVIVIYTAVQLFSLLGPSFIVAEVTTFTWRQNLKRIGIRSL